MISIFNRTQLLVTYDRNRILDVIEILKKNKIEYSIKIETPQLSTRSKKFGLGNLYDSSIKQIIYVKKKDERKANHLCNITIRKDQ